MLAWKGLDESFSNATFLVMCMCPRLSWRKPAWKLVPGSVRITLACFTQRCDTMYVPGMHVFNMSTSATRTGDLMIYWRQPFRCREVFRELFVDTSLSQQSFTGRQ